MTIVKADKNAAVFNLRADSEVASCAPSAGAALPVTRNALKIEPSQPNVRPGAYSVKVVVASSIKRVGLEGGQRSVQ